MNLSKAQAIIARKSDALFAHGLSFNDLTLLYLIRQAPDSKLRRIDLAEKTGLTASGITRLLQPLEKMGLIAREVNPRDARVSIVTLTTSGLRAFEEAITTANTLALEIIPEDQLLSNSSLSDILKLLGANIS